jgi:hypothetical protein
MNKELLEKQVEAELEHYFDCARSQKCPKSMKKSLYATITSEKKLTSFIPKFALMALSLVFVGSVIFKITAPLVVPLPNQEINLKQAQADLQVAMHYMNQVSLKSLTEVNNRGIKPALIRPLAISMASL